MPTDTRTSPISSIIFSSSRIPFLFHSLLELPASLKFLLKPSAGLVPQPHPSTEAVIRQYGAILFSSVIISSVMLFSPSGNDADSLAWKMSGALGLYHLMPIARATERIMAGDTFDWADAGGAPVHLMLHVFVGASLLLLTIGERIQWCEIQCQEATVSFGFLANLNLI